MSEMIERVTRLLDHGTMDADTSHGTDCPGCVSIRDTQDHTRERARKIIAAMREPTEAQLNAARDWSVAKYGIGVGNDGATGCYRAMINAELAPLSTEARYSVSRKAADEQKSTGKESG